MIIYSLGGLHVIHVGKRLKPHEIWEPFYISNNEEPFFDERLSWEGMSDKMEQVKGSLHMKLDARSHIEPSCSRQKVAQKVNLGDPILNFE